MSFNLEDSEIYYIAEVVIEENDESRLSKITDYYDDPLANEEWTAKYQKEMNADKELQRTLMDRFEGNVEVNEC